MKIKLITISLALGLFTNAASAGNSAKVGYSSDFFYRGAQKSEESVQSSLMLSHSLAEFSASAHICSNQAVDSGLDSYYMGLGLEKSFSDGLISLYGGLNRFEDKPGNALSEAQLKASFDIPLSPVVSVYRNLSDSLYTCEAGVSYVFENKISDLLLNGSIGNTELTSSNETLYYSVGASVSKSLSETADLALGLSYVDADDLDNEYVWSTAFTFNF